MHTHTRKPHTGTDENTHIIGHFYSQCYSLIQQKPLRLTVLHFHDQFTQQNYTDMQQSQKQKSSIHLNKYY